MKRSILYFVYLEPENGTWVVGDRIRNWNDGK